MIPKEAIDSVDGKDMEFLGKMEEKRKRPIHIDISALPSDAERKKIIRKTNLRHHVKTVIYNLESLIDFMHECANRMEEIIKFDEPIKNKIKELRGAAKMARNWKNALSKKLKEWE